MTKKEFAVLISSLAAAYPSVNISNATVTLYFNELKDLEFFISETVIRKIIATSKFYPSIAEIREEYSKLSNPETAVTLMDATKILTDTLRFYGRRKPVEAMEYIKSKSDVLYKIVKSIGFINICNSDLNMLQHELARLFKQASGDLRNEALLSKEVSNKILKIKNDLEQSAIRIEMQEC